MRFYIRPTLGGWKYEIVDETGVVWEHCFYLSTAEQVVQDLERLWKKGRLAH